MKKTEENKLLLDAKIYFQSVKNYSVLDLICVSRNKICYNQETDVRTRKEEEETIFYNEDEIFEKSIVSIPYNDEKTEKLETKFII